MPGAERSCGGRRGGSAARGRAPGAPSSRPRLPAGVGRAASIPARRERVVGGAEHACGDPPPSRPAPRFPRGRLPRTPAAGVCTVPPAWSPRGLAGTPASREEVAGGDRRSRVVWQTRRALFSCCFSNGPATCISGFAGDAGTLGFGHRLPCRLEARGTSLRVRNGSRQWALLWQTADLISNEKLCPETPWT